MAHQSDNARPLSVQIRQLSELTDLPQPDRSRAEVWLFVLPFGRTIADAQRSGVWFNALDDFAGSLNHDSIIAILTSSQDAAETWSYLGNALKFQLWVAVKLASAIAHDSQQLHEHHAALLILSKYRTSLRHTKTRIAYTFCPACDKTTKDYGGKKHTYHEYGTLVSDVWRDIDYTPGALPIEIVARLGDLFGLEPYKSLTVVDASEFDSIKPKRVEAFASEYNRTTGPQSGSQLINGDSLEALRTIQAESIDFCFADPPYNLDKRYDAWDDAINVTKYLKWCDDWLDELARILRPGCTCAVLNIPLLAIRHFEHMKRSLNFQSWIVWEGLSLPVRFIMPAHYSIVCFSKGAPRPLPGLSETNMKPEECAVLKTLRENYCVRQSCIASRRFSPELDREPITDLWWDIHRLKHNSRRVDHPCQLPPALMRRLIALFTNEGEMVLDPFNGAGTTTLCAEELGRKYIGIELSEQYHKLAMSRHDMLRLGDDPFAKIKRVPKAKNSKVQRIGGIQYMISKKALQLEVRRISQMLDRIPTRDDVRQHSRYPIQYYDEYFISWGEVCAAARHAGMSERRHRPSYELKDRQAMLFDALND
jgi:site-specific DNA-methyltransferase (adenine-specific)